MKIGFDGEKGLLGDSGEEGLGEVGLVGVGVPRLLEMVILVVCDICLNMAKALDVSGGSSLLKRVGD